MAEKIYFDITEIKEWYDTVNIKESEIKTKISTISNANKFFKTHLEYCIANNNNKAYLPYYDRLVNAKNYIIKNNLFSFK